MKKIMVVFGTRPEAIKMAPVIKELYKRDGVDTIVCVTGQHREMLNQVLEIFDIKPDYNLEIMKESQTLGYITSTILMKLDEIIKIEKPDIVVVHGDTTTTFAASLSAFYNKVEIAHVEAGLRTYNKYSPYPEEVNRQMVGIISDYNFAPTKLAYDNLIKEGKNIKNIYITGNTAIDVLKYTIKPDFENEYIKWLDNSKLILLTAHRRENIGVPLERIFEAVKEIVDKYQDVKVIYPVHKNPVLIETAKKVFGNMERIKLIEPLDVVTFHNLISKSHIILTDSGGIQEEAPALNIPVVVLRDSTERQEGVEAGTLLLAGTDKEKIVQKVCSLMERKDEYERVAKSINPYGDGTASSKIVDILLERNV